MNFYALNETPINGWATRYGQGLAGMSLAATGKSARVVLGAGKATLALQAQGAGIRRAMAYANAEQVLSAEGEGTRAATGEGLVRMALQAEGEGHVTQVVGGRSVLRMVAPLARPGIMVPASGKATLGLQASADARIAKGHFGAAHPIMVLEAPARGRGVTPKRGRAHAQQWIHSIPRGRLIAYHGAAAHLQLESRADGRASARLQGAGQAVMPLTVLRAVARHYREIRGEAVAGMAITARAQDHRIAVLPSQYSPAPSARQIRVNTEPRTMAVPHNAREAQALESAC